MNNFQILVGQEEYSHSDGTPCYETIDQIAFSGTRKDAIAKADEIYVGLGNTGFSVTVTKISASHVRGVLGRQSTNVVRTTVYDIEKLNVNRTSYKG
tara:strand:- start:56 stop:346 length:291 start_codon:yes stop_codon:yes gene_type:complete